jgi:amidase
MGDTELCFKTAQELVMLMTRRDVSAREVLDAHLTQIERVNPSLNAIVTLAPERAFELAARADAAIARGVPLGPLHGLPVAHKDLAETKGIRTTYGSPITARFVPDFDALHVERMVGAGAVTLGKTNVPEWGTGSQTYNRVFGPTRNPYDPSKTCGGSSGGAAAALAARMIPIADGSDLGGSLRNPASFCNVVGLRPSLGRVPRWPAAMPQFTLPVVGPMARTVADAALQMQVLSPPDPRSPMAAPGHDRFGEPLGRDFRGTVVAWSDDLGGLPVDPRVSGAMGAGRQVLADLGCEVRERDPDLAGAEQAFSTFRTWYYAAAHGEDLRDHPDEVGEHAAWEIEQGRRLTGADVARAEVLRGEVYERMLAFLTEHEFLVTLVSQVPPFPVEQAYPAEIAGSPVERYRDWMRSCSWLSVTQMPAVSVPFGFTDEGLPVGLQVVGRPAGDFSVLQLAQAIETAVGAWRRAPELARSQPLTGPPGRPAPRG